MSTFILTRDDVRTDLHPRMWQDICDELGVTPDPDGYPDEIEVTLASRDQETRP